MALDKEPNQDKSMEKDIYHQDQGLGTPAENGGLCPQLALEGSVLGAAIPDCQAGSGKTQAALDL